MSERKKGEVAMVTGRWIRTQPHVERRAVWVGNRWSDHDGSALGDYAVSAVRPLLVIDPEDAEQVERLADAVQVEASGYRIDRAILCVGLGKGLREFAAPTPPKPDEPQGLGAVVEDATGVKWVRAGYAYSAPNWRRAGGDGWTDFAAIRAVRVLSEGVNP